MSATIRYGDDEAVLTNDLVWTGENKTLVDMLNSLLLGYGSSPSDPNPSRHEAERIADDIGAEVLEFDKPAPISDKILY